MENKPQPITIQEIAPHYPEDSVHGFGHIMRVLKLAKQIHTMEPQTNWRIIRAAVLLHDIEGATGNKEQRLEHQETSAIFAAQFLSKKNWPENDIQAVCHAIKAHRFRKLPNPETIEAKIVFDADKIDAIGTIGVARSIAYAVSFGNPIFFPPSQQFLTTGKKQTNEPHSSYHEYHFKLRKIIDRLYTTSGKKIAQQKHKLMCEFYETLAQEQDFSKLD